MAEKIAEKRILLRLFEDRLLSVEPKNYTPKGFTQRGWLGLFIIIFKKMFFLMCTY